MHHIILAGNSEERKACSSMMRVRMGSAVQNVAYISVHQCSWGSCLPKGLDKPKPVLLVNVSRNSTIAQDCGYGTDRELSTGKVKPIAQ